MKPYPQLQGTTNDNLATVVRYIVQERTNDIIASNNLPNQYIMGRKVARVPASATDVLSTDQVGDFNFDPNYIYIFLGTAWRRAALMSW